MNLDNPTVQAVISFLRNHKKFQAIDWFKLIDSDMPKESRYLLGLLLVSKGELDFIAVKKDDLFYALQFYRGKDYFTLGVCKAERHPYTSRILLTIPIIRCLHAFLSGSGNSEDPTSLMFKKEIAELVEIRE